MPLTPKGEIDNVDVEELREAQGTGGVTVVLSLEYEEWERKRKMMHKPQMIIFDYGHTLLYEPGFDAKRCEEAAFAYITHNPQKLSTTQIYEEVQKMFQQFDGLRNRGIEIHEWQFMRLIYEYLGIEFSISYKELEEIEWNAASMGAVMPHAEQMLNYLNERGIRTAVISNIGWSGRALTNRINRLLPDNKFLFVSFLHKFPLFSRLCTMPASKYVSFSLVFALMGKPQGKDFLIQFLFLIHSHNLI